MRWQPSQELGQELLQRAVKRGASAGEVQMVESDSAVVSVRLGEIQNVSQARQKRLGLRLFFGHRVAGAATSDISEASLARLLDRTCSLASATAQDHYGGLPDPQEMAGTLPQLDLLDPTARELTLEQQVEAARAGEDSALRYDGRINNSEGAESRRSFSRVIHVNSQGFSAEYESSTFRLSVSPVAYVNGLMERDHWFSSSRKYKLLDSPAAVGREAARRVMRRLGVRKVRTRVVPVVFESRAAGSIVRHLAQSLSGYALYRGASFLQEKLGQRIASAVVDVVDDGTIPSGLGSRPFDAEGVRIRSKRLVDRGVLTSYLLDSYSARKLGRSTTGNASRAVGSAATVAPTNLYLVPGPHAPEELVCSVDDGFYVTDLMGFGVNLVTGDYSQGAAGIWIEKGELAFAVEGVTIAGNLREMLGQIEMVGNDLDRRSAVASPTIKVSRLTVGASNG